MNLLCFQILFFHFNNIPLTFNFNKEYFEDIIVHNRDGGGNDGINILSLLYINDWLIDIIKNNYNLIKKPYISIHMQNTDYKTDYINFYNTNINIIDNNNIFLATDSIDVLNYYKQLKNINLYSFINCLTDNNKPIHLPWINTDKKQVVIDTISDLIILALSDNMLLPCKYYGFTILAYSLHKNKNILFNLINYNKNFI
jgi:hypothetical protein